MDPALQSSRVSRLKKRFLDVLSGSVKLEPRGAALFLEGFCAQDDPVLCLGALTDSTHGLPSLQSAMQSDLSVQFMNGLGSNVLGYLLKASDVGGDALDNLLFQLVEPPIFWGAFVHTFQQGELEENAQLVFAQTLSRLLTLQGKVVSPYRDVAAQLAVQERLATSPKHEIREMGYLIKHIVSTSSSTTARNAIKGPGGRHDNDFANFRDISILPTADEILCRKPPFLRTVFFDEPDSSEKPVETYLDNSFRMLREDMIYDIRQEVQSALQKKGKRGLLVCGISMVGIYTGDDRKTRWGVKLQCASDFWQLRRVEKEARVKFLTQDPRGSRILRHQSLVCLASDQDIISFGTVNRVEQLLALNPPIIVLQLDDEVNIRRTLATLRTTQNVQLIQVSTSTFAYEPVLSTLKTCSVPLWKEICFWNPGSPIEPSSSSEKKLSHVINTLKSNPSVTLNSLLNLPRRIHIDNAQAKSLVSGLQQRVSLIQGPPGTGKSFIGAIIAKAMHDQTAHTILVVCYTNHALDQFLCDLIAYGIPHGSIVRLGGRSSPSTDHLALQNQPRPRIKYDWDEINLLKSDALQHEAKLGAHFSALLHINGGKIIKHLVLRHHEFFEAFRVPLKTEDGMRRVGPNGQDIDQKYLFSRWKRGQNAGVLKDEPHVRASARIWNMPRSARQDLLDKWQHEFVAEKLKAICHEGKVYNKLQDRIQQKFAKSMVSLLSHKRIIACTTTGAAIHAKTIAQAGPDVLLVEEAGEILESHILTAMSQTVKQMILIGDHKQLRPKVNNYQLTVEKGEGFDLNRSLFERLVLKGYPHVALSMQHRMRPTISAFVRELTYPELTDAPSTNGRPDIRGIQSNIIFVNHAHPEEDNAFIGDRADSGTKASKQNMYEVDMVLKIVRYLAQQGYRSEDMVVLTPYLGQLHRLREAFKDDSDPILNELDTMDLARVDLTSSPSETKAKKNGIHLATIDNYQGEESNIVIASLTRSNRTNMIGFMDSPERLNVLLSRARDGLILIGDSQTFLKSRKGGVLWNQLFTLFENGKYVYQGFPVKCERHPECIVSLSSASDFDDYCPDGGCTAPCGFFLTCGHMCPMKCHPQRQSFALHDSHDASQCTHRMCAKCSVGLHIITWECREGQPIVCVACDKEVKRLEEIVQQELEALKVREEASVE